MGMKLSDIEEGGKITLFISQEDRHVEMDAIIKKRLRENISLITLLFESEQVLNFDNVKIEVEHKPDEVQPFIWRVAQIARFKGEYVLQVQNDGQPHNRRDSFRVGVSVTGRLTGVGRGTKSIIVRDVSISGFAITDRKKELNLVIGNTLSVYFEDCGHILDLSGRVVRTEEHEDAMVYGCEITNLCKDLSSYISTKQRQKRMH